MHHAPAAALIFGGGHISKSLAKVLDLAGFRVSVVDNREAFANRERFPEAAEVHAEEYEELYPKLTITESTLHRDRDARAIATTCACCAGPSPRRRGTSP